LDTNFHFFEIRYTGNTAWFIIDNVLRHVISTGSVPITTTLSFPMALNNVNSSGATNRVLGVRNIGIGRFGNQKLAPHEMTGYKRTAKTAQYTTAQTGVALWTPAAGKRLVILSYQIQAGGTTAGTVQLWFGASGDTTYTRGTDLAIFDGEFAPSTTSKPGVVQTGVWEASIADHILRVTDSAAINPLTITVWGYEV
jgi:hypothetical protein